MSKTSVHNESAGFSGDGIPSGQPWSSGPIYNTPSPAFEGPIPLTNGTTAIPIPAGSLWIKIIPTTTGAQKTWKGANSGDTGTRMHPTLPVTFWFDPAAVPSNVYIAALAAETVYVMIG